MYRRSCSSNPSAEHTDWIRHRRPVPPQTFYTPSTFLMDALLTMANMKNTTLALTFAVAAIAAPAAFGMHYKLEIAGPILPPPVGAPPPPHVVFSGCSADSNTIAVGIDWLPNGI